METAREETLLQHSLQGDSGCVVRAAVALELQQQHPSAAAAAAAASFLERITLLALTAAAAICCSTTTLILQPLLSPKAA